MEDRRLSRRVEVEASCIVYFKGEEFNCRLLNVSETGMCIETERLEVSDKFDFIIYDDFAYGRKRKCSITKGSAYVIYRNGNKVGCRFCAGLDKLAKYAEDRYVVEYLKDVWQGC